MSDQFSVPHIWSPAYGRPNPQPQHGYPMQSGAPYGMQTMGLPSNYPGGNMPFQPRPPSLSQCLGLPRSMPGGINSKPQSSNTPMPEGVELQENGSVYCKNCDKNFPDVSQFRAHEAHHRKCDVHDCSFVGTQRAVNIHREEKHSAVSHLVPSLETPEQIAKWREARRRNFPTAENVDRKKATAREREERGQVARNEVHRHRNGRSNPNNRQRNRQPARPGAFAGDHAVTQPVSTSSQPQAHATSLQAATPEPLVTATRDKAAPVATSSSSSGLGLLGSYGSGADSSDDEDQVDAPVKSESTNGPPPGAVHGAGVGQSPPAAAIAGQAAVTQPGAGPADQLIAADADADGDVGVVDDDGDEPVVDESAVLTALLADAGRLEPSVLPDAMAAVNVADDVAAGKVADVQRNNRQQNQSRQGQRKQKQRQKNNQSAPTVSKPSLLEKLLNGEVRRERNVLLQCIRHIVRHDFLDQHPHPPPS